MAKKRAKVGKKAAKKTRPAAKKSAKKSGKAAGMKRKSAGAAPRSLEPQPVSTGRGPAPAAIGSDLVQMFNAGRWGEIEKKWWEPRTIRSIEGMGVSMAWNGADGVGAKNAWWAQDHVIHGASAEGPYVGATGFAVKFRMDVETKSTGKRETMEEVGVYTVKDGKIVQEEFMYFMPSSAPAGGGATA